MKDNLSERVSWQSCLGKRYLLLDYSKVTDIQAFQITINAIELLAKEELNSAHILVDLTGTQLSSAIHHTLRKLSAENQKYIAKSAIIGMSKFTQAFFKVYQKVSKSKAHLVEDKESGLEYLFRDN